MSPGLPTNPSADVRRLNPGLWPELVPPAAPAAGDVDIRKAMDSRERREEKDLQGETEKWLSGRGYLRLTSANISIVQSHPPAYYFERNRSPCRGFFGHWFENQCNAFMPDLFVVAWPNDRPCLLLELKVRSAWQPGQKAAISMGLWKVAFDFPQAVKIVTDWEGA